MRWWLVVYGEGNRNTDKTTDLQSISKTCNVVSSTPQHKLLDVPYTGNVQPEQLNFIFCLINKMREIALYKTLSILRSL
jgi:hypothetical protein